MKRKAVKTEVKLPHVKNNLLSKTKNLFKHHFLTSLKKQFENNTP